MTILTASEARSNLYRLIDQINTSHEPTFIKGKKHSAVLIGEEDWRAIQETLYLTSIPGMAESIIKGMKTPSEELIEKLDW
ncbi:MAG: type II toxin-antitoxin system Phd/YefM family antitoxin [Alphaproteobacteria bacterium]|nr:type II toxin-antitoxin system Phd/YefM family antitoxin [Alphaproteobacteria bacterium]